MIVLSVAMVPTAAAGKKTELEKWQKTVEKIAPSLASDRVRGLCVCMGGAADLEVGVIQSSVFQVAGNFAVTAQCLLPQFDTTTEQMVMFAGCSTNGGTWVPLVK
jgi:hypothetical protein